MEFKNKKDLIRLAHALKPVVMIGSNGLTESVHNEIEVALEAHELIKIRVGANDADQRKLFIDEICEEHSAELVQKIGSIAVFYRKNSN